MSIIRTKGIMSRIKKLAVCGAGLLAAAAVLLATDISTAAADNDTRAVRILGVVTDAKGGSLESKKKISREQFAAMLLRFINESDAAKNLAKRSLFSDVKKDNGYRGYINAAAIKGYMRGYSNGKFENKKSMTLGMAAYSSLKMLGYTDKELLELGESQLMSTFNSLQLNKGIGKMADDMLTGSDCTELFSNLMYANTKSGSVLGKSLGYRFAADGSIDVYSMITGSSAVMIAQANRGFGLGIAPGKVYRNDKEAKLTDIERLDTVYYNKSSNTAYAYSDRAYGQLSDIQPSVSAAKSVTVGGKVYELAEKPVGTELGIGISSLSQWRSFFNKNGVELGSYVVAIKDLNGKIIAVYQQKSVDERLVGYVLKNETKKLGNGKGGFDIVNVMTIAATGGGSIEIPHPNVAIGKGNIVRVSYDGAGSPTVVLDNNSKGSLNGKAHLIADNVRAIEVSDSSFATVLPGAIKALDLTKINAEYIGYDSNGKIVDLIFRNALGTTYSYGIVTEVVSNAISYIHKGNTAVAEYEASLNLDLGRSAVALGFADNKISTLKPLSEVTITKIDGSVGITSSGGKYMIADDVDVYYKSFGTWKYDSVKDMKDLTGHTVKGYFIEPSNMIRLIIIEK